MRFRSSLLAVACSLSLVGVACGANHEPSVSVKAAASHPAPVRGETAPANPDAVKLDGAMRQLWADHMQYTIMTVDAFFHDNAALQPRLNRLLQNQKDIGAAIAPYFGQDAATKLTDLLTTHINQAVPVLTAARNNDQTALKKASDDWYANAREIADFLSGANPGNWPVSATEPMLKTHIDQTTAYAVDLLKNDYAQAITDYDTAFSHMMMLADTLAQGITAKFPDKVSDSKMSSADLPRTE
ncbi:MAG TPA: glycosyltransferase [Acidimicrobiia bacterium]|nr:glycosyltransferase [Acidimicrobiia bacterium]